MNINYKIHNYDVENDTRICINHFNNSQIKTLKNNGFITLNFKLNEQTIELLSRRVDLFLDEAFEKNSNTYKTKKFAGKYIRNPHLNDMNFLELLTNTYPIVDMARSLIGPRITIRSYSIRITMPESNDGTMWHSDQRSYVTPIPQFFTNPQVFTFSIYLDGANDDNGALYLLPGSQDWPYQPKDHELFGNYKDEVKLNLKAGETVLFNSALWHKGGENRSNKIRRSIIIHFAPIFCKVSQYEKIQPSEEYLDYVKNLRDSGNEAMLELLGYNGLKNYPGFM